MGKNKKKKSGFGQTLKRMFFGQNPAEEMSVLEEEQIQSPFHTVLRNIRESKLTMTGIAVFLFIFLCCLILPFFFPVDLSFQDPTQQNVKPGFSFMNVPKQLAGNAKQIDNGPVYGVGIDNDGNLYEWGNLTDKLKKLPKNMGKIEQISAGQDHVLALNEDGEVFTWGYDRMGLGKVPAEVEDLDDIKQIEAGYQTSFALTESGDVYFWGNESATDIDTDKVEGKAEKIVSNPITALCLTKDNEIVCMSNRENVFSAIPEEIQGHAVDVASTDKSGAALLDDGRVVVWGSNDYEIKTVPEEIQGRVTALTGGRNHFTALLDDGTAYSWGGNNNKQAKVPSSAKNLVSVNSGYYQNYGITSESKVVTWGLKGYLMGTDALGRDIFSRLLTAGRMTMTIGAISVVISAIIGILVGGLSGYYGGKVDMILMRLAEIVGALPFLPLAMILSAVLGNKVSDIGRICLIMVILGILSWPGLARLVRGQILAEREKEFVTAAKAMGIKESSIIFKHILPNVITVIIVNLTISFATCLLTESSLSFLGFGVTEPSPTWGNMLSGSQSSQVIGTYWWRWVFPSIALSLSTISINIIGDGLRDAIDPKSNER